MLPHMHVHEMAEVACPENWGWGCGLVLYGVLPTRSWLGGHVANQVPNNAQACSLVLGFGRWLPHMHVHEMVEVACQENWGWGCGLVL